jgi:hypothetical protein
MLALHYSTLRYTTLHYTTLHYTAGRASALHDLKGWLPLTPLIRSNVNILCIWYIILNFGQYTEVGLQRSVTLGVAL